MRFRLQGYVTVKINVVLGCYEILTRKRKRERERERGKGKRGREGDRERRRECQSNIPNF